MISMLLHAVYFLSYFNIRPDHGKEEYIEPSDSAACKERPSGRRLAGCNWLITTNSHSNHSKLRMRRGWNRRYKWPSRSWEAAVLYRWSWRATRKGRLKEHWKSQLISVLKKKNPPLGRRPSRGKASTRYDKTHLSAYRLEEATQDKNDRSWNVAHLLRCICPH